MYRLPTSILVFTCAVLAQHQHEAAKPARTTLLAGMGQHHHAIETSSAEAQKFFDEGFTLMYGFNHEEAIRSFEHAISLNPKAPMPYWGIALALGPNINHRL